MRLLAAILIALSPGCGGGDDGDDRSQGPAYSLGDCPELVDGRQSFASGDLTYQLVVDLPAVTEGAPLIFIFHHLGGDAEIIGTALGADALVEMGAVVLRPEAASTADFEWQTGVPDEENDDLRLFHDLLGCARRQLGIDLDRVWATGMSAGGLWTSYLIVQASDWLTAAAPFSGGYTLYPPTTARQIPVMITWGGETDRYASFNFDLASSDLSFYLSDFGHPIIECVHDLGHDVPSEAPAMLTRFFRDLRWGEAAAPGDILGDLPTWCRLPE